MFSWINLLNPQQSSDLTGHLSSPSDTARKSRNQVFIITVPTINTQLRCVHGITEMIMTTSLKWKKTVKACISLTHHILSLPFSHFVISCMNWQPTWSIFIGEDSLNFQLAKQIFLSRPVSTGAMSNTGYTIQRTESQWSPTARPVASVKWLSTERFFSACRGSSQQNSAHFCLLFHKHRGYGNQMEPLNQPRKAQSTGWITKNRQPAVEMSRHIHTAFSQTADVEHREVNACFLGFGLCVDKEECLGSKCGTNINVWWCVNVYC